MPRIINKAAKKSDILHAAMRVFARKGVVNTKMIDVAEEARVGKGTIYEYFRSKEEIFITAFEYVFDNAEMRVREALARTSDPVKKLEYMLEITFASIMGETGEFAAIMMDFWAEGVRTKDTEIIEEMNLKGKYANYRELIATILKDGIKKGIFRKMDVNLMSSAFLGALDGLALQWILDPGAIDMKKVTKVTLDGFLNGIKSRCVEQERKNI